MQIRHTPDGLVMDFTVEIPNSLHSRPSARMAQIARQFQADIILTGENGEADAKSMLEILSLSPKPHAPLRLLARGEDAEGALEALRDFLNRESVHGQGNS